MDDTIQKEKEEPTTKRKRTELPDEYVSLDGEIKTISQMPLIGLIHAQDSVKDDLDEFEELKKNFEAAKKQHKYNALVLRAINAEIRNKTK